MDVETSPLTRVAQHTWSALESDGRWHMQPQRTPVLWNGQHDPLGKGQQGQHDSVLATVQLLQYAPKYRPFFAVHSESKVDVLAWLALRENTRDIDMQMPVYNYTAFSQACERGLCDIVQLLLDEGANTSIPNHLGLTGRDIVEEQAKLASRRPEVGRDYKVIWKGAAFKGKVVTVDDEQETAEVEWVDAHMHGAHSEWHPEGGHQWSMIQIPHIKMKKLLDEYIKAHPKHMLSKEKQRRLHRPIEDTSHEHPEIHFERIGYWDRYNSGQGKYERFVDLQEGANGKVIEVPADLPFRDRSGRLHYRVVAKATKLSGDIEEMDRALFSEIQTLHDLERKSNYSRRPAFPFFSL